MEEERGRIFSVQRWLDLYESSDSKSDERRIKSCDAQFCLSVGLSVRLCVAQSLRNVRLYFCFLYFCLSVCLSLRGAEACRGASARFMIAQCESYLRDMGMTGLASAWAMTRWRRRSTVAKWTRRRAAPAYVLIPDLSVCLSL